MKVPEKIICDVCGEEITYTPLRLLYHNTLGAKFYECEQYLGGGLRKHQMHICHNCFWQIVDYVRSDTKFYGSGSKRRR